jgi:iron complex transport system substrate-binding protein
LSNRYWIWGGVGLTVIVLMIWILKASWRAEAIAAAPQQEIRNLQYLGKDYAVPVEPDKIVVAGALEVLEDLLVLGVKPTGVMTIGGTFPEFFNEITQNAKPIGERMQPNLEAVLTIKPDIILSSDKFSPAVAEQFKKIAPTIPLSHFPGNGEANLRFLGELTGKQQQAEAVIKQYSQQVAAAQISLPTDIKTKKVVAVRIRAGNICIYPADLFFNEILYKDLGFPIPNEIKAAKAQEVISQEKFSEMDPDYIFLQYEASESSTTQNVVEDLQRNPVWQSMKAVKNNRVFINVVNPLIQGVAIGGKTHFIQAAVEKLSQ